LDIKNMVNQSSTTGTAYSLSPGTTAALRLFVTTGRGIEGLLLAEIAELVEDLKLPLSTAPREGVAGVSLEAPFETMVALNMGLTTASRITWTILEGYAPNAAVLQALVQKIAWEKIFDSKKTFKVEAHCKDGFTQNSMFLALKVKDAIADFFRNRDGVRPNVDTQNPDVTIMARLQGKKITISLDTTGETLSNHGYRVADGRAPLRENLAAAMVRATGWCALARSLHNDCEPVFFERESSKENDNAKRKIALKIPLVPIFADPMCGTGTLGIEAALCLLNKKPNAKRGYFAFESMQCFKGKEFSTIRSELSQTFSGRELSPEVILDKIKKYRENALRENITIPESSTPIIASDIDVGAISSARKNALAAGVNSLIDLGRCSFFEDTAPSNMGVLVMNPPYGERLEDEEAVVKLYGQVGDMLKHNYKGWMAWIISSNAAALKNIGLRPTRKFSLFNGQLPCQYQQYILY
jgi:putative N6-adenine-specific DNA methylase